MPGTGLDPAAARHSAASCRSGCPELLGGLVQRARSVAALVGEIRARAGARPLGIARAGEREEHVVREDAAALDSSRSSRRHPICECAGRPARALAAAARTLSVRVGCQKRASRPSPFLGALASPRSRRSSRHDDRLLGLGRPHISEDAAVAHARTCASCRRDRAHAGVAPE